MRSRAATSVAVAALLAAGAAACAGAYREGESRRQLFDELRPVPLAGCGMKRFGAPNDGGYLLCGDLLDEVEVAYSYGIAGRDSWGCDVSRQEDVTVHQYDCFDTRRPRCRGGSFVFHPECIGARKETIEGRPFDSLAGQIAANGDGGRKLLVKMDVEGAEWESLAAAPESVLKDVQQLTIEFHHVDEPEYLDVVRALKQHFHVAHIHFNNVSCKRGIEPFPAWAYEVLLVNKSIADVDEGAAPPTLPHPLDAPNSKRIRDCQQALPTLEELERRVRDDPTAAGYVELGVAYHRAEDFRGAIEACRRALALEPDHAMAYNNLCAAHARLGEWERAEAACQEALARDPELERARANLDWVRENLPGR